MLQSVVIITAKQTVRWSHNRLLADAATAPNHGFCCRCGKGRRRKDATQGPVERVHRESGFRNGTESRVLLPLWKGEMEGRCRTGACSEDTWERLLPQRHRIMGFAAVVERGTDGRCRTGACSEDTWERLLPQRHRIAGFAAVAERRTDNVAGKSRRMADNVVQMIFVTFGA